MNYTIENEKIKLEVSSMGAEMQSIMGKKTGSEYLWQGKAPFWTSRATNVFPICGRLFEGKYTWKGKEYEMGCHGFAKLNEFELLSKEDDKMVLILRANESTRKIYPFEFELQVKYQLVDASVKIELTVINDAEEVLPFAIGGHPGFNVPFIEGENFEDYFVEFSEAKPTTRVEFSPSYLITGRDVPYELKDGKIIQLKHDLFDDDAIFLTGTSKSVSLKSKKNNRMVTVSFKQATHVGLWHNVKMPAPFVCIEPWSSVPAIDNVKDDFSVKREMVRLNRGEKYNYEYDITITE